MREPNQMLTMELPERLQEPNQTFGWRQSCLDFTATDKTIFVQYRERNFNPPTSAKLLEQYEQEYNSKPQSQSIQLYKVIDDGKLELVNRFDWTRPVLATSLLSNYEATFRKLLTTASPPAFDLLWSLLGNSLYKILSEGTGMMQGYAELTMEFRPHYSSLNYVLSTMMIGFAIWHGWARRTLWVKLILWLIIVGAFNLAGLLTYLALNHTPVIKCPACGKKTRA